MSQQVSLGDKGKEFEVHRFGDPGGEAIVYSHGLPSSGLEARILLEQAEKLGYGIIAITRPGYGQSSSNVSRTLKQLTEDYLRILDRLGIAEFYAVGTSAGAKDALSLAHREPGRVNGVSLVAPFPSIHHGDARNGMPFKLAAGLTSIAHFPGLFHGLASWLLQTNEVLPAFKSPEEALRKFTAMQPEKDREVLTRPEVREKFLTVIRDWTSARRKDGMIEDLLRVGSRWGFDLQNIGQHVQIIHGALDPIAPVSNAHALAAQLKNSDLHIMENTGHASYAYSETGDWVIQKIKETFGL